MSYSRRDGRYRRRHSQAWDVDHASHLVVPPRSQRRTSIDPAWRVDVNALFRRRADVVVEIGTGTGEAILHAAQDAPDVDHLGIEVYQPGLARTVIEAHRLGLANLRMLDADARQVLATALPIGSIHEIRVFFPDPWPKLRHHKRRLVDADMVADCARALRTGGALRLATDWPDYAAAMREAVDACNDLVNPHLEAGHQDDPNRGYGPRFAGRPMTRFEQKALAGGRSVHELELRRI